MTRQEFEEYMKKKRKGMRGTFVFAESDETGNMNAGVFGGGFEAMICIAYIIKHCAKKADIPVDKFIEAITMIIKDIIRLEEEQNREEANKIIEGMFNGKNK